MVLTNIFTPVLKILADPQNVPAMVTCRCGKDRSLIVAALVMGCFGESKEDIAKEYSMSEVEYRTYSTF